MKNKHVHAFPKARRMIGRILTVAAEQVEKEIGDDHSFWETFSPSEQVQRIAEWILQRGLDICEEEGEKGT